MATKMRNIMSYAPVCLAATDPVWAAARAMRDHGIGAAPDTENPAQPA